ncbi:hypothetical protein [Vibrio anguillarum]|uniref:hypothetical protein n=1 Tax=Vibrio anguillarum TaxID=55601 RepID=UPI0030EF295C
MFQENVLKIRLFHGTTLKRGESIVNSNFDISTGDEDWLGTGVYFFLDGISSGLECAEEWALNTHEGQDCCVVEATVEVTNDLVFDLTSISGLSEYNIIRNAVVDENYDFLEGRRDLTIKKRRDIRLDDKIITNKVMEKVNKNLLIHNVYIKNQKQRQLILESSYPNSTVACLNDLNLITEINIVKKLHNKAFKSDSQRLAFSIPS